MNANQNVKTLRNIPSPQWDKCDRSC